MVASAVSYINRDVDPFTATPFTVGITLLQVFLTISIRVGVIVKSQWCVFELLNVVCIVHHCDNI